MYRKVCHYCELVLKEEPENTVALFRKGVALYRMEQFQVALTFLEKASRNPGDLGKEFAKFICDGKSFIIPFNVLSLFLCF